MKKYTYKNNRGESIQMGTFTPFIIESVEGISEANNRINTTRGMYQDGNSVVNKTVDVRHITITGAIEGVSKDDVESLRRQLVKVLNAKYSGVFTRTYKGITRKIDCEIESIKFGEVRIRSQKFMLNLLCNDPYWYDIEESTRMSAFINLFKFPLAFPMQF